MKSLMTLLAVGASLAATSAPAAAAYPDVVDTSFVMADGARTLQESIEIHAPVAVLWKGYVDAEQYKRWNSPVAAIDLRVGGSLEASYDAAHKIGDPGNIRHRIITYLPERLIVFQNVQTPPGFPHPELFQKTVTILEYQALAPDRTRVTLSSTGWGTDPASAEIYTFFQGGNAELLEKMKSVFEAP